MKRKPRAKTMTSERHLPSALLASLVLLSALILSGCNTWEGMQEDVGIAVDEADEAL